MCERSVATPYLHAAHPASNLGSLWTIRGERTQIEVGQPQSSKTESPSGFQQGRDTKEGTSRN